MIFSNNGILSINVPLCALQSNLSINQNVKYETPDANQDSLPGQIRVIWMKRWRMSFDHGSNLLHSQTCKEGVCEAINSNSTREVR